MSDQQQPGQRAYNPVSNNSAVQASDTSQAPAPTDSRTAMAFPTGDRNTSALLVEETGPREVRVGQPYNYEIRVTNLTNQPLNGVVLTQRIPANFRLTSGAADTAAPEVNRTQQPEDAPTTQPSETAGRQARINIGDLGPRQTKTVQMSGIPSRAGQLDTCLSARYNPPTLCAIVAVVAPQVKVVAEGPSQSDVCQDLVYRYTVSNTGTGTARNVVLQANLPEGLQTSDGQKSISAKVGDLAQGQSKEVTARLRAMRPGKYTTDAMVRSDAGEARSEQVATTILAPRLAVTVDGPKQDYLGQPMVFHVTVKNVGDAAAADTKVRLGATPGKVQFVSAQNADGSQLASEQEGTGQSLGTLAPGQARTVAVTFNPLQGGPLSLDATAKARCAEQVTTPVNTNILTITASALVVTHDPDPVPVGNDVTYHIVVQNKGTAPDKNVKVTAEIPPGEHFIRSSGDTNATANGQTLTFGTIPVLAPKQSMSWNVIAKAQKPGDVEFKANMTSDSTKNPAVKIEPTKLFGGDQGTQQRTNEANPPAPVDSQAPATAPAPDLNK